VPRLLTTRATAAVLLALSLVALPACRRQSPAVDRPARLVFDGRPRVPDVEGVVVDVDTTRIVLDGNRSYPVSPYLQSFATTTGETLPIRQRKGEYVQIGLRDKEAVWVGSIGPVVALNPPVVFYIGRLVEIRGKKATFADGTVLQMGPDAVDRPADEIYRAEIDPTRHYVRQLYRP
jgi:hypothetical protein